MCHEVKLIIELDGGQHAEQKEYDHKRITFLEKAGYIVIRIWNNEVVENMEGVWEFLENAVKELFPSPNLPPPAGGGIRIKPALSEKMTISDIAMVVAGIHHREPENRYAREICYYLVGDNYTHGDSKLAQGNYRITIEKISGELEHKEQINKNDARERAPGR